MDYLAVFVLACVFITLERLLPLHPEQRIPRRDWANDLLCVRINGFLIRALFTVVAGLAMRASPGLASPDPFPMIARLPLWVRVIAVIIVADIGYSIAHRLLHSAPFRWRLQVVHHSIEQIDWPASHRLHPLEMVFSNTVSLLPVRFQGLSFEALVPHHLIYLAHTLLLHTNFRLGLGPLEGGFRNARASPSASGQRMRQP